MEKGPDVMIGEKGPYVTVDGKEAWMWLPREKGPNVYPYVTVKLNLNM